MHATKGTCLGLGEAEKARDGPALPRVPRAEAHGKARGGGPAATPPQGLVTACCSPDCLLPQVKRFDLDPLGPTPGPTGLPPPPPPPPPANAGNWGSGAHAD